MKKLLGFAAILASLTLTFTGCPGQVPDVTDPTVTPTDDTPPVTPPEETDNLPVYYYEGGFFSKPYSSEKYKVIVKDTVTEIQGYAFSCCRGLTSISIPDSVTSIGGSAFSGCTGLTSITIPDSVTSIGACAFSGCTGLTSITIPESVTTIYLQAFEGCTGLTSIILPGYVAPISYYEFLNCDAIKNVKFTYDGRSSYPEALDWVENIEIVITDSVTSIGYRAFANCKGLTSITIPDSVTSIEYDAFSGCTNATVYLPTSKKDSFEWKFSDCKEMIYY